MGTILEAFKQAIILIFSFDPEFYRIVGLSIVVSGTAAVMGSLIGIPVGVMLAEFDFKGRKTILTLTHTFMGLPPVVAGLFFFLIFKRSGPLGFLDLIYKPGIMIMVQTALATPIVAGFTHASIEGIDPRLGLQAQSLGANKFQSVLVKMREGRPGLTAAVIAGFGRVIAEVGAVMIVGGNLLHHTRVLTTDIVLQTRMGNDAYALAEGIVLILIAIFVNVLLTRMQAERGRNEIEKRVTGYPT
ncbi:MAG: ABC transporter permease [Actinobacteria bacterium]|nr:ABC transporter permease [Actinomycetota bacterium]